MATSFDNMANAINKRLIKIAERYGTDSRYYEAYINQLKIDNVALRKNAAGVLQISRGKGYNKYHQARVQHLYEKGKTVTSIRKSFKKKHPGQKFKPGEIDNEIKKAENRQKEINDTLETLYKYYTDNILPTDIVDKYDNFRNHDTSNNEIDEMIEQVKEFDNLHAEIEQLEKDIGSMDEVPIDIMQDVWEISNGRQTLEETKAAIERVKEWMINHDQDE